jgi:hypothetical protein
MGADVQWGKQGEVEGWFEVHLGHDYIVIRIRVPT